MLSFAQHPYLLLADKALPMWVKLLQDAALSVTHAAAAAGGSSTAAAAAAGGGGAGSAGSSPRQPTVQLPPDCIEALMTMAAEQLQVRMERLWFMDMCFTWSIWRCMQAGVGCAVVYGCQQERVWACMPCSHSSSAPELCPSVFNPAEAGACTAGG